ncbi:TonB-dependent receptor [Fibrella forsythiae]|uniref:TonB-dependent receptor n=1 Tax=Fibrella forsythiae TaxID=2817061 RepID=A0ABS3JF48_9BACT|nr:TonB-dependent receptor [Fibrella forsythiae]MBO0948624.1 TonB-dependent receptor [Fibrella forsythiae]
MFLVKNATWLYWLLLLASPGFSQQTLTVGGFVADSSTGERLVGAVVRPEQAGRGTTTNAQGYFTLIVRPNQQLNVSFIGYESARFNVDSLRNGTTILLRPVAQNLAQVTVTESRWRDQAIGITTIPIRQLRQVPMLFGESDLMKALAFTPGVTVGNEGTSGLLVRGGSPDQNLILLDDVPLYNQSHLFGLVSTFNPDAVKNVTLYKGAFPARFGGRLSSVVDVTMRDGNTQDHKREVSVGLISSRFLFEGPLSKKTALRPTYMVSARSSYLTLFLLPVIIAYNQGKADNYANYWLYDINAKLTLPLSATRRLSVSLFRGHDYFYGWDGGNTERSKFQLDWGNTTATVRYHQAMQGNLFLTGMVGYSNYQYQSGYTNYAIENRQQNLVNEFVIGSSVRDWIARGGLDWHIRADLELNTGFETTIHRYVPSALRTTFTVGERIRQVTNSPIDAFEQAIYVDTKWQPSRKLTLQPGLRLVGYRVGSSIYPSAEPRLALNWNTTDKLALKAGYSTMRQFVHLLSSNAVGLPNDIWVPATITVPPQRASQLTVGLATSLGKAETWQLSVEGYYKWLNNLIDLSTGANLLGTFDATWEQAIERNGRGLVRGLEVMLHKPGGRLNGWLAYTYARSDRQFATINDGRWFRANFDRRHVGNVVLNYQLKPRVAASVAWQYQSGQPATVPVALVRDPANAFYPNYVYGDRNNFQSSAFHRLDLSVAFTKQTRKQRTRTWTWGVINAYNRQNPLFLTVSSSGIYPPFTPDDDLFFQKPIGYRSALTQQSLFPVLPYLAYSLKL